MIVTHRNFTRAAAAALAMALAACGAQSTEAPPAPVTLTAAEAAAFSEKRAAFAEQLDALRAFDLDGDEVLDNVGLGQTAYRTMAAAQAWGRTAPDNAAFVETTETLTTQAASLSGLAVRTFRRAELAVAVDRFLDAADAALSAHPVPAADTDTPAASG